MYEHWTAPTPRFLTLEWYADAGSAGEDTISEAANRYRFKKAKLVIDVT